MKIFIIALFCFSFINSNHAQDKIMFVNGTEILSKVIEINNTEIKYKLFDNQNGPTIITLKKNIFIIKYENGTKEVFTDNLIKDSPKNIQVETKLNTNYCVKKGDKIIDAFYGINNFMMRPFDIFNIYFNENKINSEYCLGGKIEYLIKDRSGIGTELSYYIIEGDQNYSTYDSTGFISSNISLPFKYERTRCVLKINQHFYMSQKVDIYYAYGLGISYTADYRYQLQYDKNNIQYFSKNSNYFFRPSMIFRIGLRTFLSEKMGLNAEIGIGGPLFHTGLSFKL